MLFIFTGGTNVCAVFENLDYVVHFVINNETIKMSMNHTNQLEPQYS